MHIHARNAATKANRELEKALRTVGEFASRSNAADLVQDQAESILTTTLRRAHTLLLSAYGQIAEHSAPNAFALEIDELLKQNRTPQSGHYRCPIPARIAADSVPAEARQAARELSISDATARRVREEIR
jgi:hypothetical protein